ncbi:two-component system sensor histidine kinase NtrB [Salinimicrobium soli]|uniref:two-component system sensor histidine kinase NtrB n=1 Tax=Salinimicrobium soli TaxID=1254399 RepID=UPI003AAD2E81
MSGTVVTVALAVLISWIVKLPLVLSVFSGAPTMKFNTALGFVLAGLGLISVVKKDKLLNSVGAALGTLIIFIGFLSFLEYFINVDLHIDNLFWPDTYTGTFPGRMARTTGLCFTFFGVALLTASSRRLVYKRIHKFALGFVALISVMAILTFFLQSVTTSKVLVFNSMAFHTAINFLILSLGLSLIDPRNSYIDFISGVKVGSKLARKLLPFLITMPLVLGIMLLYIAGSEVIDTELGIALFTVAYALVGLLYTTWISGKLNIDDLERRRLEHSLELNRKELMETARFKKKLVTATPEFILIINLSTLSIRYLNKDLFPLEGLQKDNIEGMPLINVLPFVHPRDREKLTELHRNLIKSSDDEVYDVEVRLKLKENKWEWFSLRGKVFNRPDGVWLEEYMLLMRNITHQKRTQKELMRAKQFSIQGEIARTLAHELRNPIASIGMVKQVLAKSWEKGEKEQIEKYLEILGRSSKTLEDLVNNLLNSSKYEPAQLSRMDLAQTVESSLQKAADRIYLSGVEVIKNYSGAFHIFGDDEKLEITILNIILNASEATIPDEGIIEISIVEEDSEVVLSIADNGEGLEKEQVEKLFEAFYTSKDSGMGVGLNSVKNIIEEHQARITVDSTPNEGTRFRIFFPKADLSEVI